MSPTRSPAARGATIGLRCGCAPHRQLMRSTHVLAALLGCAVVLLLSQQCAQAPSRLDGATARDPLPVRTGIVTRALARGSCCGYSNLMTKTNMTNTNIRIRCRTVGQNFGTVGQIVARNGRVVAETRTFPYGFTGPATDAARSLAATKGWTVRS